MQSNMGWRTWLGKAERLSSLATILREPFHILTTTLLSLLLPLSFLLLSRLSCANYFFNFVAPTNPTPKPISFLVSLFTGANPTLLLALLSVLSVATLVHCVTGNIIAFEGRLTVSSRPRLYTAWVLLFASQVCVCLEVQESLVSRVVGHFRDHVEWSWLSKAMLFVGLHETMVHWCRVVVKPVVDDTVLGFPREERWIKKAVAAVSFSGLWWCRLREEVESLVVVPEVKREMSMDVAVADFVAWWLYYLTVTIGAVKLVKGFLWLGVLTFSRRFRGSYGNDENYSPGLNSCRSDKYPLSARVKPSSSSPGPAMLRVDIL